jgi:hypothetical protein
MIYFIEAVGVGHIKIGFTDGDDALVRLATLQTGSPVPLRLLGTIPGTMEDETNLHRQFAAANVTGEWFKPIPDLLAMIPASAAPSCEGVTIAERSVTIRVLTVGRKQFSKSLLEQLAIADCLQWHEVFLGDRRLPIGAAISDVAAFDLLAFIRGHVWGWVAGGYTKAATDRIEYGEYRWIVFENEGRLFKSRDYVATPQWLMPRDCPSMHRLALTALYRRRTRLAGWRDEDQLFFGV